MDKKQLELLEKIRQAEMEQSNRWIEYWQVYSDFHAWQFWLVLAMFVIPLVVLILLIDRKRTFQLCFYGYSVHLFFAIMDAFGALKGLWIYPYKLLPVVPASIPLDASFVPASYILVYQYILNKRKNYYIWMLLLCLVLAFFLKPLFVGIGLFHFGGKENFLMLFWCYAAVALIAKWMTDFFIFLSKTRKWSLFRQ